MKKKTFDIMGSCVSRDLFNIPEAVNLDCREYIARHSILSMMAKPVSVEEGELDSLTSNFQKEMVLNDLRKTTLNKLRASKSNFLIIDFIDERFKTIQIFDSCLTMSNELVASKYLDGKEYQIIDKTRWNEKEMERNLYSKIIQFAEQICSIYKQSHIIIHEAKMVDRYIGKDGEIHAFAPYIIENNKRVNLLLDRMYMWLKAEIPRSPGVIDITSAYLADENHKWGLSAMHYQAEYYQNAIKEIENIIYGNKIMKEIKKILDRKQKGKR